MAAQLAPGSYCVAAKLQVREPATSPSALRGFCSFRTLRGLQFSGKLENLSKDAVRPVLIAAGRGRGGAKPPRIDGKNRGGTKPAHIAGKNRREMDENDAAEAALEALFLQLEKDLESEGEDDDDGDITEEEMAAFEKQLEAALMGLELDDDEEDDDDNDDEEEEDEEKSADGEPGLVDMVMTDGIYGQAANGSHKQDGVQEEEEEDEDEEEEEDEDEDEDEDERTVPLEKWQIRRLAAAVEQGRRHVNVKSLAAELGMDRTDVLFFLKNPPPELLLMSASFEESANKDVPSKSKPPKVVTPERNQVSKPATTEGGPPGPKSWHSNKRLRKEHVATFERVYRQTHRPSNAMIENLVVLTHVPRKKIVQWFDDRRLQNESKKSSFNTAPEM